MNRHTSIPEMSSLDLLGNIPRGERILLKIFLRKTSLSKIGFSELVKTLSKKKNISEKEINEGLQGLLKREWVKEEGNNYTLAQRKHRRI